MSGTRSILIVEDEPLIAMMLEDFILSLGHDVTGNCDSVKTALAEVEKGNFDLAIQFIQQQLSIAKEAQDKVLVF